MLALRPCPVFCEHDLSFKKKGAHGKAQRAGPAVPAGRAAPALHAEPAALARRAHASLSPVISMHTQISTYWLHPIYGVGLGLSAVATIDLTLRCLAAISFLYWKLRIACAPEHLLQCGCPASFVMELPCRWLSYQSLLLELGARAKASRPCAVCKQYCS